MVKIAAIRKEVDGEILAVFEKFTVWKETDLESKVLGLVAGGDLYKTRALVCSGNEGRVESFFVFFEWKILSVEEMDGDA